MPSSSSSSCNLSDEEEPSTRRAPPSSRRDDKNHATNDSQRKRKPSSQCAVPPVRTRVRGDDDYTPQFRNDSTGRRTLHPSALRFAMKLMDEEGRRTTQSVSLRLHNNGEMEESKKVQIRSAHHVAQVSSMVRERIRGVRIPARYAKLEDLDMRTLPMTNLERRREIDATERLVQRLQDQKRVNDKDYRTLKEARDNLVQSPQQLSSHAEEEEIHSLIQGLPRRTDGTPHATTTCASRGNLGKAPKRPATTSLLQLLETVPSPYQYG